MMVSRFSYSVVLVVASLLCTASCEKKEVSAASKPGSDIVNIEVATVSAHDINRVVETVGTLYPYDETVISAEIDGRVDEVKADLGDAVKQGDLAAIRLRINDLGGDILFALPVHVHPVHLPCPPPPPPPPR